MLLVRIIAFVTLFFGITASASAQPSYSCRGNLNPTERTICNDAGLSKYDRDMANKFVAIFDRLAGDRKRAFRNQQTRWRRDRDACGPVVGCIRANYVYRILQFDRLNSGGAPSRTDPGPEPEKLASAKVLPDGSIEKRLPDGGRVVRLPDGTTERYLPDGTKLPPVAAYKTGVQPSSLPPLPETLVNWGSGLEGSLLGILDNSLTEAEYSAYLVTEEGKFEYELIDWRLRSIAFLTQP